MPVCRISVSTIKLDERLRKNVNIYITVMQIKDLWYEWNATIFNSFTGVRLWRRGLPFYLANSGPGRNSFKDYLG